MSDKPVYTMNPYHAVTCPAAWTADRCNCGGWYSERRALGLPVTPKPHKRRLPAFVTAEKVKP